MDSYKMKTCFIRIELEPQTNVATTVVQSKPDIRMGIVAGRSDEFLLPQHLIPFAKTLVRSLEIVCEKQIWVTVVRPERVKECDESVNLASVSKYVVNLDTIGRCFR